MVRALAGLSTTTTFFTRARDLTFGGRAGVRTGTDSPGAGGKWGRGGAAVNGGWSWSLVSRGHRATGERHAPGQRQLHQGGEHQLGGRPGLAGELVDVDG